MAITVADAIYQQLVAPAFLWLVIGVPVGGLILVVGYFALSAPRFQDAVLLWAVATAVSAILVIGGRFLNDAEVSNDG